MAVGRYSIIFAMHGGLSPTSSRLHNICIASQRTLVSHLAVLQNVRPPMSRHDCEGGVIAHFARQLGSNLGLALRTLHWQECQPNLRISFNDDDDCYNLGEFLSAKYIVRF
jgi:hypothetical protein